MSNESPSRRDFLKTSAAATVGASLLSHASVASAYAAGDDTIRVGLIGSGGRGRGAASQALSTQGNVKLVAVADAFGDRLDDGLRIITKNMEKSGKGDRVAVDDDHKFVGFDAYQRLIDSDVDLVILTTPPGFRPIHLEAAVAAGKHVFMEKPVATDAPGIRRVLAAVAEAKKKDLKIGVGLQRHHQNTYLETIDRIHNGAIGDVVALRVYWNGGGVWEPRASRDQVKTEMEYQMRNWYYYAWLCGDHICEQHIHNLDVGNWVMGGYPVKCRGMGGRQVRTDKRYGEIFDHFAVQYEFESGGQMFSECRHIRNVWNSVSEHAHGSKGTANIGGASIKSPGGDWRYRGPKNQPYQTEHDNLFAAIREGKPYNEGENGAFSTLTAIMGRMATYSGKEVTWEQALNSELNIMPDSYTWDTKLKNAPNEDFEYAIPLPGITKAL
ncbi:MAG: dehydrogenase [Planctomycetaceae bacterium]|nr:dehydrogenase [Planctomycetaceae bacterium]